MSRSRRKTPIIGMCANARTSEKEDKQIWHREFRRHTRQRAKSAHLKDDEMDIHFREFSNPWSFTKDGKMRITRGGWRDEPKTFRK